MAYSGTRTFNLSIEEIIEEAYERCGLEVRSGYDLKSARRSMNLMFSDWANRGLNLWTITLATQATTASDKDYSLDTNIIDLLEVSLRDSNNVDTTLSRISRADYEMLPDKSSEGKPSQFYFERTTTPTLFLYPTPDLSTYTVRYYFLKRLDDIDEPSNNANVPFRFLPCLTAGMAYYLAMKKAPEKVPLLKAAYDEEFKRAMDEDRDRASFSAVPGRTYFNNY